MPKKKPAPKFKILIDTREKQPWTFQWWESRDECSTEVTGLKCGDYTLEEFPELVIIERKKNFQEMYSNLIPKEKYERFMREVEKLKKFKHIYLIIEQNADDLFKASTFKFTKQNKRIAGAIVWGHLMSLMAVHNIHVIFAGDCAQKLAYKILKKHYERATKK